MLSNFRRLELTIVAAGLLVMLLSSKPPRSGNAGVRTDGQETAAEMPLPQGEQPAPADASVETPTQNSVEAQPAEEMPGIEAAPRMKRVGIVDARNSGDPKYTEIMYGEVTVRWVWNGQKFVPQKVCIVDEGNGVTSVWSFGQQDGVIVSERQEMVEISP